MGQPQGFKSMQDQIQAALIATTRSVGQIASEDLGFQRSLNPDVGTLLDEQSARLLVLSNQLLQSAASIADLRAPNLEDADDVENNWRGVIDVVDSLLEKADGSLDEFTGIVKRTSSPALDQNASNKTKKNPYSLGSSFRTQNILKPQLSFQVKPDNYDDTPWKPILREKPHAIVSLEESLSTFTDELGHQQYKHPYEPEITQLHYPDQIYQKSEPIPYLPVDTTTATFVDTYEGVLEMLKDLKQANEIAIDLEHHDARSYVGLVSLMQVSTREKDWIVDTLKPWRQDLQVLNEVFTDPNIVKVFHGAYMDIVWLQRDLGLYVTGLFDTHHASRALGYPGGSLAYLLKRFIDFDADKKYQMADWRIRPLPEEMFYYARADTHFLLYIYDNMRNELLDRSNTSNPEENSMEIVLSKSKETSLLRYERQIYEESSGKGPGGWYGALFKSPALFSNQQFAVFRAVHSWRDQIARKEDDSTATVMPNHVIFKLAKEMPTETTALYGSVHPISHSVKARIGELLEVIKKAKAAGSLPDALNMLDILKKEPSTPFSAINGQPKAQASPADSAAINTVDQGPLRSEKSQFWGTAFGSSVWEVNSATKADNSLRLAIPMPQLAADAFSDTTHLALRAQPLKLESAAPTPSVEQSEEEEAFVLKAGRKRKSEAISTAPLTTTEDGDGEYDIALNEEDAAAAATKVALKAERKAAKKAEKARKRAEASGASTPGSAVSSRAGETNLKHETDEEPFDYSKAESVLHAKRDHKGVEKGVKKKGGTGGNGSKPFDPYKKSEDAAKGMRRVQSERAGKSFTFKK